MMAGQASDRVYFTALLIGYRKDIWRVRNLLIHKGSQQLPTA